VTRMVVSEAVRDGLFASPLQPSDALSVERLADAICRTMQRLGAVECAGQVAQEFGDHPREATDRMRWVRQICEDPCFGRWFREHHR
jgi:hypothetical protein